MHKGRRFYNTRAVLDARQRESMSLQCCQRGCQLRLTEPEHQRQEIPTYTLKPRTSQGQGWYIACTHRITPPFPYNKFRLYYRWHGSECFAFWQRRKAHRGNALTQKHLPESPNTEHTSPKSVYMCLGIFFHAGELRLYERKSNRWFQRLHSKPLHPDSNLNLWSYCTLLRMHVECVS